MNRPYSLVAFLCLVALAACTPKPSAVVLEPLHKEMISYPARGAKVAIIVRDGRSALHSKLQFCGAVDDAKAKDKGYAYLANKDGPDGILAVHLSRIYREAGYEVVAVYPEVGKSLDELDEKLDAPPSGDAGRYSSTAPGRFDDPRIPREEEQAAEEAGAELEKEVGDAPAPEGDAAKVDVGAEAPAAAAPQKKAEPPPEPWYKDAHAVVYVTFAGCATDSDPKEVGSTLRVSLAIQAPTEKIEQIGGAWTFEGQGPFQKATMGFGGGAAKSVNIAYRTLVGRLTNFARTPLMHRAIAQAAAKGKRRAPRLPSSYAHKIPSTYELDIDATPEQAEVRIDGQLAGRTPVKGYKVGRGKHHVVVQKNGYESFNDYLFIMSPAPLDFVLVPKKKGKERSVYNPF